MSANLSAPIYILGTGLFAEECHALAVSSGRVVEAFVENLDTAKVGTALCGRPVIAVTDLPARAPCICALSTTTRRRYIDEVAGTASFATLIHRSCTILPNTSLGEGSIASAGVLVGSNTTIGRHVLLNRGAQVGHHARIGDFVTIQPGANIAGAGSIGDETYVGMGAIVIERLTIGRGVTIAAGALVKHDVPDHVLVAGSPAVIKKRRVDPH